ncbi:restriction endonuclease subunit S [Nostoc sp. UHCC 0702]|nr:restriction endonuclease subunit S [Nostoc sp. UHCC 0702]
MATKSINSYKLSFQLNYIDKLPDEWKVTELENLADIVYGVQAAVANLLDKSFGIPIFTNINITLDGTLDLSTLRYYEIPENKYDQLILKKGDILFNWRSGSKNHIGKTALFNLEGDYTFSSFILRFRCNNNINNIFLLYYLQYLRISGFFAQKGSQSSVNSVFNASSSAKIPVLVPPLHEQKEIAHTLRTVQKAKETCQRELELERERKAALMQYLFTHGTRNEPREEKEIGEIPKSWDVVKLGELLKQEIILQIQDGNHGERHPRAKDYQDKGVPILTADCIRNGQVIFEKARYLNEEWLQKLRIGFAQPGDVLLTHKGTIGEVAFLTNLYPIVILTPQITYYRVSKVQKILNSNYLVSAFQSSSFINQLKALASTQSTRAYVGITNQQKIKVALPDYSEQKEITEIVKSCDRKISSLEKEIAILDELFQAMLEQLMTGKLSTQPLI